MKLHRALIAMAFAGTLTVSAIAQEKKSDKPSAQPAAKPAEKPAAAPAAKPGEKPADKGAAAGQPSADDMKKMMDEMSKPAKELDNLKPMEGSFTCAVKFWMAPGQPPQESTGNVTRKWIMGGRYLQEEFKGEMMKMPFEGMAITGFDKAQKKYHSYWIDTMNSGMFTQMGTADASGKKLTFTGDNFDPMEMKVKKTKSEIEIDAGKQVMKMYDTGPDGKEWMNFEMTCTRK